MSDASRLGEWMNGYIRAWSTNDASDIRALFTDDAEYFTAPFRPPWRGLDEIVAQWIDRRDEPGTWRFAWEPVVDGPDLAVIQGETVYDDEEPYSNLWVLRFEADGRCSSYTEWFMAQSQAE